MNTMAERNQNHLKQAYPKVKPHLSSILYVAWLANMKIFNLDLELLRGTVAQAVPWS